LKTENNNSETCPNQKYCKTQIRESSEESCDALAIAEILQKFRQSPFVAQEAETQRMKTSKEEGSLSNQKRKECCIHQNIVSDKEKAMKYDFNQINLVHSQVQDIFPTPITPMLSPVHTPPHNSLLETAPQQSKSAVRELPALYHIVHLGTGSNKESFHAFATLLHGRKPGEKNECYSSSFRQIQPILPRIDFEARTCLDILQQLNNVSSFSEKCTHILQKIQFL